MLKNYILLVRGRTRKGDVDDSLKSRGKSGNDVNRQDNKICACTAVTVNFTHNIKHKSTL